MKENKGITMELDEQEIDEQEIDAAKKAAENDLKSTLKIKLRKPVPYNNITLENLEFDYDDLTGKDCMAVEAEMATKGKTVIAPAFSSEFLLRISAKACTNEKIGYDAFMQMNALDCNKIRSFARNFFMKSE